MAQSSIEPVPAPKERARGRALVADDARIMRSIVRTWLGGMGFEVDEASCGLTALARTKRNDYDLIFLDINMPGLSGLTVLDSIRRAEDTHHIPVVLLTTLGHAEDFDRGLSLGASAYLTKPISMQRLVSAVRDVMRS
ncbi:MAG: response regulator [Deltaproteobacteria bacterium]|nr:response regulator [Deltaproteobacteria bacterium]